MIRLCESHSRRTPPAKTERGTTQLSWCILRGFPTDHSVEPLIRYWLIEGHLRLRYLNALEHLEGVALGVTMIDRR